MARKRFQYVVNYRADGSGAAVKCYDIRGTQDGEWVCTLKFRLSKTEAGRGEWFSLGWELPVGASALAAIKVVERVTKGIMALQQDGAGLFTEELFLEAFDTRIR